MDLKQQLTNQALRLMQDPRVMKAIQHPGVMRGVMGAIQLRARLQDNLEQSARDVAKRLSLATQAEVRELRRTVERLERELADKGESGVRPEQPEPTGTADSDHAA